MIPFKVPPGIKKNCTTVQMNLKAEVVRDGKKIKT